MKFKYFIFFIAFALMSFSMPKHLQKKVSKEIEAVFELKDFALKSVEIPSELLDSLPSTFGNDNLFAIHSKDLFLGYAYISKAASKADLFDYLVLFDKDLIVVKAKVLIYREDYGGEIGSRRWLKQFIGKTQNDELRYGDNIIAISGATISVRSMTLAVNDLLKSMKMLHSKQIL